MLFFDFHCIDKNINIQSVILCCANESKSYGFVTTWEWVTDERIVILCELSL